MFKQSKLRIACAVLLIGGLASVSVAGITITERDTRAQNTLWVGSGGAVDQFEEELRENVELTGPFAFASSGDVSIVEGGISNGAGSANGSVSVLESISLSGDSVLTIETGRNSNGTAQHESGTANAYFTHNSETRLRFETDVPLFYEITGSFNPDPNANIAFLQLNRPFSTLTFFNFQEAQDEIEQSGIMPAGNTYQFRVRIRDQQNANAGNPSVVGVNQYGVVLTIAPIACAADLDENGTVDLGDLNLVLGNFGQDGPAGDANRDGTVNLEDLNLLLAQFTEPCPIER
jgi:hypothetical protein